MSRPCLILSDTHLSRQHGRDTGRALARLVAEHPEKELLLAGDVFDLSLDQASVPVEQSAADVVAAHPELTDALGAHLRSGGKLTIVPGNHDAGLVADAGVEALRTALIPQNERQLEVAPWFARRGSVHVEHGHLYDRDCAPNHPLADPDPTSEGLGTAMMRRFVAPNDAIFFAHAHKTTPVSGIRTAFEKWGAFAPVVIARYFGTAFQLCGEALVHKPARREQRHDGDTRLEEHSARTGLGPEVLRELLSIAPTPTHESFRSTVMRLYFDRIFASISLTVGLTTLSAAGLGMAASLPITSTTGVLLTAVGGSYLGQSVLRRQNRYGHGPEGAVGAAAQMVREATGSRLVVFGHTHVEVDEPGYVNLGSFAFGHRGRPYLLVDGEGNHERMYAPTG